ncbi:MAG: hypothetical protein JWQ86_774 [Mycobacterium sp.]|nr:hypothetical protein [Mycobacterium sp.]
MPRRRIPPRWEPVNDCHALERWKDFGRGIPQNHADLGWALTNQWHADSNTGSPPVGWYVDVKNGSWSLVIHQQSSPGAYLKTFSIIDVPLAVGTWHDVKMQIKWSKSDTVGSIKLWLNGVQQTFVNGSTTYNVRTLIPGSSTVYYKEGMYRQATTPTGHRLPHRVSDGYR